MNYAPTVMNTFITKEVYEYGACEKTTYPGSAKKFF